MAKTHYMQLSGRSASFEKRRVHRPKTSVRWILGFIPILLMPPFYTGRELLAALALFSVLFAAVFLIVAALFVLRESSLRVVAWLNRRALVWIVRRMRTEKLVLDEALLASPIPLIPPDQGEVSAQLLVRSRKPIRS